MRGKLFFCGLLAAAALSLSSCRQLINSPSDELRMYSWSGSLENGTEVSLSFDDDNAYLSIDNGDTMLDIGGICVFDGDRMIICDGDSGANFTFAYKVYSDRAELGSNGCVLSLEKQDQY